MWPFSRKKKDEKPPPELDRRHSYVVGIPGQPVKEAYPTAQPAGKPTYATRVGGDLPDIRHQDELLVHFDRVPDGGIPRQYWSDRDANKNQRNSVERRIGVAQHDIADVPNNFYVNPKWVAPPVGRPTTDNLIPVLGHGVWNPTFAQDASYQLTGNHASMALLRRNFPIGGMEPVRVARNTYRQVPPSYDASSADMASTSVPATNAGIYVSPSGNLGPNYGLQGSGY